MTKKSNIFSSCSRSLLARYVYAQCPFDLKQPHRGGSS